jgi:hypothetical protein
MSDKLVLGTKALVDFCRLLESLPFPSLPPSN